jgi:hypothetical protein
VRIVGPTPAIGTRVARALHALTGAMTPLLVAAGDRPLATVDDLHAVLDSFVGGGATGVGSLVLRVVRGVDELDVAVSFGQGATEEGSA